MAYFQWSDEFFVGNKFIDADHKKLLILCNKLHDAMTNGAGKEDLGEALSDVIQYAKEHFKREEDEMRRVNYPDLIPHRQEHHALLQEVSKFQREFSAGNTLLTVQVSMYLKDWLVRHIIRSDKLHGIALKADAGA
jgi:hemerythrin-like metal-binding protein